jgi:hypothetical protein
MESFYRGHHFPPEIISHIAWLIGLENASKFGLSWLE